MRDLFITEGIDERKVLNDAKLVSRGDYKDAPEVVQVHWHKKTELCSGLKHRLFKDGYAQEPGSGPQ